MCILTYFCAKLVYTYLFVKNVSSLKQVLNDIIIRKTSYFFQLTDVAVIHEATCPNFRERKLQLSADGVSESKSTNISLDVYSVKFNCCKNIYPLRIVRPIKKVDIDHYEQLKLVVDDIYDNDCIITMFIGDNLKRAIARCCLNHASWFPCEYCFAKGTKLTINIREIAKKKKSIEMEKKVIAEKIAQLPASAASEKNALRKILKDLTERENKLRPKHSHIVWPKTSADAPQRTREEIFEIIQKIENNQELTIDEAKGIAGRSVFFDIPSFNFVRDIPVDYLHCTCIGVVKRCVELTFKVGSNRPRITKRPLSSPLQFNLMICKVKVFKEFNRRVRDLDFAVYKGQEYRNLLLFFFPLVLNCIEKGKKERKMWLYLSFAVKACVLPKEEFAPVPLDIIDICCKNFYAIYQELFGETNCSYNTHITGCHMLEMRFHGPLTFSSAFSFESFYGELRKSFVPGTMSPLKQIMANIMLKRVLANHNCETSIYLSAKDTPMECNSLFYTYQFHEYKLFKIVSINDNEITCKKIKFHANALFPETPNLQWGLVGVFQMEEITEEEQIVAKNQVKGKVILVDNFLITCPKNILQEK